MRSLQSLLVISLALLAVSCATHQRAQYSYSYRAPVHVDRDKPDAPLPGENEPLTKAPAAATLPAAH